MNRIKTYTFWNNLLGWMVWGIASWVFISTAEKTTSWWDCGEYISTASRLMVGHPPGAPTFQLLGSVFSMFAMGNVEEIGHWVNIMSALCSSFTILFLFWTITLLARKLVRLQPESPDLLHCLIVFGAGLVGSLAYTFSDSFWFSAVEGEVYAMSSFFTAITFWAILKWESEADQPHNLRWIVFIAFMIGLAIGVHLLNLLVIPAIVFTVYYKKFYPNYREDAKKRKRGFWLSVLISVGLLALILWGIVPYTVRLAGSFELFFVNTLGLPFNVGTFFYLFLLAGLIVWGLVYAVKKNKVLLHTALLCWSFILIGYSTFFILVIRANEDVPINQGENKDAISLLAYLNRDQYGTTPLLYGQYFTAKITHVEPANPQYVKNEESGRYDRAGYSSQKITYDDKNCGLFPRIWSNMENGHRPCVTYNKIWSGADGKSRPTFGENMRYLVRYQLGWMYFRYFMWNFVGRQNDEMGRGYNPDGSEDLLHGNWLSGIDFIDEMRLGPQDELPDFLAKNPARNTFYFLPLLLGLIGLVYHCKKDKQHAFVTFLLFFMTGIAIVLYLNSPSTEPRERDYAYAGSFYAFAIWIGLGVVGIARPLADWWNKKSSRKSVAVLSCLLVTAVCTAAVPGIMAVQGWDDHDRSNKTSARDFAKNNLLSCEEDAVLIVDGDNDTFPLWYCQQVEGIRTDVRVINSMLANSSWMLQPLYKQVYASEPFKMTLPAQQYQGGKNEGVYVSDQIKQPLEAKTVLNFVASEDRQTKLPLQNGESINFFPGKTLYVDLDKAENPERITWTVTSSQLTKSNLAILDLVVNNWSERPIYFLSPYAHQSYLPTVAYTETEGCLSRLQTYRRGNAREVNSRIGGVNTEKTYRLLVEEFDWGSISTGATSLDPETRDWAVQARNQYLTLAVVLKNEGQTEKALNALDKGLKSFPDETVLYQEDVLGYVVNYYALGEKQKAEEIAQILYRRFAANIRYFLRFPEKEASSVQEELEKGWMVLSNLYDISSHYGNTELAGQIVADFNAWNMLEEQQ